MEGTDVEEKQDWEKLTADFQAHLELNGDSEYADLNEEEEEEFSFMFGTAEELYSDGRIKEEFPLFDRDLIFSGDRDSALRESLPMTPPVKKVFAETSDDVAGPYCEWSSTKGKAAASSSSSEVKKSNSTGFSKFWRFKELAARSNSDGRDAFVFLNHNRQPKQEEAVKRTVKKGKTASLSAHELYLKSKAKEDERRRTYLPYRPELMGFFTNVNGGLTKNVHPY